MPVPSDDPTPDPDAAPDDPGRLCAGGLIAGRAAGHCVTRRH